MAIFRPSNPPVAWQGHGAPWDQQSNTDLLELVDAGLNDREIGAAVGRSPKAVQIRRALLFRRGLRPDGLTMEQVAGALGVTRATVSRYLCSGALSGVRLGMRRGSRAESAEWRVDPEALRAFIAAPERWGRWRPERITDPYWREVVDELQPPRLVSTGEAARRLHYTRRQVLWLVTHGRLPGVRAIGPTGGVVVLVREDALGPAA